jgi:FAD:protein FMN transferase
MAVPQQFTRPESGAVSRLAWCSGESVIRLAVTDPTQLRRAGRLVSHQLTAVQKACLRPDAELGRLARAGGRTLTVSPLLAELVAAALMIADRTGGDVDPTVLPVAAAGRGHLSPLPTCAGFWPGRPQPNWHQVRLQGRDVTLPAGVHLDLRHTAAAFVADRAAIAVSATLGTGVLVGVDNVTVTAGPSPFDGWSDGDVRIPADAALATATAPDDDHGRDGQSIWRTVRVLAFSGREAQAYSLAALVRGTDAPGWLRSLGVAAELITSDGQGVPIGTWSGAVR